MSGASRRPTWALCAALVMSLALGCGEDAPDPVQVAIEELGFDPVAALATWPEVRDCRFTVEHDALYMRVLVDPHTEAAYQSYQAPLGVGAIALKAIYDDEQCTELVGFAAMRRLATGTAPDDMNWAWWALEADGRIEHRDATRCVGCHVHCDSDRDMMCTDP